MPLFILKGFLVRCATPPAENLWFVGGREKTFQNKVESFGVAAMLLVFETASAFDALGAKVVEHVAITTSTRVSGTRSLRTSLSQPPGHLSLENTWTFVAQNYGLSLSLSVQDCALRPLGAFDHHFPPLEKMFASPPYFVHAVSLSLSLETLSVPIRIEHNGAS